MRTGFLGEPTDNSDQNTDNAKALTILVDSDKGEMEAIIKQEVIEKEPREVILTWKEKPKELSKYAM